MDEDFPFRAQTAARRRTPWRTIVATVLAAFLLGGVSAWLLLRSGEIALPDVLSIRSEETKSNIDTAARGVDVDEFAGQQGDLDQRMTEMEQRLARLGVKADAAAGNATRAEGLLIAFAARRAVERGDRLGYLADQLRMRFGVAEPDAVRAVLATEREPVTLDQLLAGLDRLAPQLGEGSVASEDTLDWLSRELGELFVVRREDAPSPAPERRLDRARWFLESGRTAPAIAEVRNLPNADSAGDWIADAERYAAAQRGLERIEAAAILEPDNLRDGAGQPVRQPTSVTAP
jgi:hypothetical protein